MNLGLTILSINIRLNWWTLTDVFLQNLSSEHLSERNIWVFFSAMENYLVIKYVWFVLKRSIVNNQNHNWKLQLNFHIPLGMLKTVPKWDVYLRVVDTYSHPVYGIADCSIFNQYHFQFLLRIANCWQANLNAIQVKLTWVIFWPKGVLFRPKCSLQLGVEAFCICDTLISQCSITESRWCTWFSNYSTKMLNLLSSWLGPYRGN